jgi:uncharacterized membrane protein
MAPGQRDQVVALAARYNDRFLRLQPPLLMFWLDDAPLLVVRLSMALQAPAIVTVGATNATPSLPTWLRGIGVRQVRLTCGLVMFTYIFSHFFNHALGNISFSIHVGSRDG